MMEMNLQVLFCFLEDFTQTLTRYLTCGPDLSKKSQFNFRERKNEWDILTMMQDIFIVAMEFSCAT